MMKKILLILLCLSFCISCIACSDDDGKTESSAEEVSTTKESFIDNTEGNELAMPQYETTNPVVAMSIKDYGTVVVELYPNIAPNTVNNFIYLVKKGFYDNNTIHRMLPGFVIQGGDPTGTGGGDPGYSIKGEFSANGFINPLKHTDGVISMARATPYDSAGCQFFLMLGEADWLDGAYAAFGKIIEGMDVCREIEKIKYYNKQSGKLNTNLVITKMVVDTKGVEYPEPEKIR